MSKANNKVRSAVKIFDFGNGVRFLYPFNYAGNYLYNFNTHQPTCQVSQLMFFHSLQFFFL